MSQPRHILQCAATLYDASGQAMKPSMIRSRIESPAAAA